MLWQTPEYSFKISSGRDRNGYELIKEITIDVTTSAPTFENPGKTLSKVFTHLIDYLKYEKAEQVDKILDFGAGKFRNALYFLDKKYYVTAVEYEKLFNYSEQAKSMYNKACNFTNYFTSLIFPHEFLKSKSKHDLVLLINVLNIMPVASERLLVLQSCYERIRQGGYLFWYTQHGDADYKRRCTKYNILGDGYYIGENRKFKSFYREYSVKEIDSMLLGNGFQLEKSFNVPHNQARLYKKTEFNIYQNEISASKVKFELQQSKKIEKPKSVTPVLRKKKKSDKEIIPNPVKLSQEYLLINKLKKLQSGNPNASQYAKLIEVIFRTLFVDSLNNFKVEKKTYGGRKRIDIVASNRAKDGFFETLSSKKQIKCGLIIIECKNYTYDIKNAEFDQLGGRLNNKIGQFGILVYRSAQNKRGVLKRCQDHLDKEEYIIALDDNDLVSMLKFKATNETNRIHELLENKYMSVVTKE